MRVMIQTHFLPFSPSSVLASSQLYEQAVLLVRFLRSKGHVAYFAGGAVRDILLQRPVQDIDIATDASTKELLLLFPKAIQVGVQFGVIRVIRHGHEFEIATFRTEGAYEDGRHPSYVEEVRSYQEDAQRRDFTINGLFYDPEEEQVIDCVGGLVDLDNKRIRTIGLASDRFQEDKLRVLRAIRFSHVLGFSIDSETWKAMCVFAPTVPQYVSGERVWDELTKMYRKRVLVKGIVSMRQIGLFQALFPFEMDDEEFLRRMAVLESVPPATPSLLLAALWYDRPTMPEFIQRCFHVSNKDIRCMSCFYEMCASFLRNPNEREIVRLLALEYSQEALFLVSHFISKDPVSWYAAIQKKQEELLPWIEQQKSGRFSVMGQDLIRKGIKPGKEMGRLLEEAFTLSLKMRELDSEAILYKFLQR